MESHDSVREFDRLNEIEVGAGVRVGLLKASSFPQTLSRVGLLLRSETGAACVHVRGKTALT